MNAREAIKQSIKMGEVVASSYLQDLTDEQLMLRPHPDCNHVNWQIGHLVASEQRHLNHIAPGAAPALPEGFAEKYTSQTAANNDPAAFVPKNELLQLHAAQQTALFATIDKLDDSDLDRPTGIEYAPTVGSLLTLQGCHWLMHAGQWVIVRRAIGKPAMF